MLMLVLIGLLLQTPKKKKKSHFLFYVKCTLSLLSVFDDSKDSATQTSEGGLFHHLCSSRKKKPVCLAF